MLKMRYRSHLILISALCAAVLAAADLKTQDFDSEDVDGPPFNFTSSEHLQLEARDAETEEDGVVKQVNPPTMVMTNDQPSHFYGFNNGEPFILDKIPEVKGESTKGTTLASGLGDYYEDIEGDDKHVIVKDNENYKPDSIDRKDNIHKYYRPNDIPSNPFKITSDLHQFLNLPVHYSTSDKFPLISNSYANMKIQGTGSNHKQSPSTSSTSTTIPPSYYTMKQSPTTDRTTTPVTTLRSTASQSTTTTQPPTTESTTVRRTFPTTTSKRPASIFDYEDLTYSDYDYDTAGSSSYQQKPSTSDYDVPVVKSTSPKPASSTTEELEIKTSELSSSTTSPVTSTTTANASPSTTTRLTSSYSASASTTQRPATTTTVPTTTTTTTPRVSIVTSLPIDSSNAYYISQSAGGFSKASEDTEKPTQSTRVTEDNKVYQQATTYSGFQYHAVNPNRGEQNEKPAINFNYNGGDEPFRPIHNPEGFVQKNSSQRPVVAQTEASNNYFMSTSNAYQPGAKKPMKPANSEFLAHSGVPQRIPPKPEGFHQQKPMHQQQSGPINQVYRPGNNGPHFPPPPKPIGNKYNMSYHTPPELRPPSAPVKKTDGSSTIKYPTPDGVTFVNMKPGKMPQNIQVPPMKQSNIVQGHPVGEMESQSYSLQTSFSIGVPDSDSAASANNIRPSQGIGQVLPATDDNEETRPGQVINTQRLTQNVRPGMVQQLPSKPILPNRPPQDMNRLPQDINRPPQDLNRPPQDINRPPQDLNRPPQEHNRPPQDLHRPQGKPIQRHPPGSPLPVRPPPNRPPPMSDMKPQPQGSYPRPHWESHSGKPQFMNGNNQVAPGPNQQPPIHSKEKGHGQYYPMNRGKPEGADNSQPLPNILPQFRPNAKVGVAEYPSHGNPSPYGPNPPPQMERRKEPTDRLRPPPLPRPQFLRINRNDDENSMVDEEIRETFLYPEKESRTNQRPSMNLQPSRVTTLQMMQHGSAFPPQRLVRNEETIDSKTGDKKPVHLVYPISKTAAQKNEGVVIVGVKGPQRPVPPPDLDLSDDDQSFPMVDKQKPFPLPGRDRPDTPILKTKLNIKPIKNEFPYPLIKPDSNAANEDSIVSENKYYELAQNNIKPDKNTITEYTAYSPTKRTDIDVDDDMTKLADEAVNLIPYLQDYMPYATKKPLVKIQTKSPVYKKDPILDWASDKYEMNKPISVTLANTASESVVTENRTSENTSTKTPEPFYSPGLLQTEENKRVAVINKNSNGNEYTLSTIMHTHPSQQKDSAEYEPISSSSSFAQGSFNHKPQTLEAPTPVSLEAPFQASISAPVHETHGWSVIGSIRRPEDELDRSDTNHTVHQTEAQTEESTFDFDNFKPQLMGGFKPILPPSAEDTAMETESETKNTASEEIKS